MTIADEPDEGRHEDDGALRAVRANDRAATERFVRVHTGWMLAVAQRIVKDTGHAEDVVQNAFASVFKNLDNFEGRSSIKTWMHRITVNESLMVLRSQRRSTADDVDHLMPVFDENRCRIEDDRGEPETPLAHMERAQTRALVSECIGQLPDKYRIVLVLRDIEELSTSQVAEMLDLSEANVKIRLHRARAALKKLLEPLIRGQEL